VRPLSGRRGFRWWLGAATLSTLGDTVTFFALGWVAAGHGPGIASLVLTVESVPLCLLILICGAVADRFGIRVVMVGCDLFMVAVMAAFAAGALGAVPVWSLITVALLSGVAAGLRRPAAGVFPRLFAEGEELSRTMAAATLFQQLAQTAGPSVAGILLGVGGLALTSAVDAVSFLLVLAVLLAVRPPYERAAAPQSATTIRRQLADAVREARTTPGAVATVLTVVGLAVTILPLVSLCVPVAGHQRGWSAGETGMVAASWVAGGLLVTAVVSQRGMPQARTALAGPVVAASGAAVLASTADLPAGVVALALVGIGTSLLTTRLFPRFMNATRPEMLGRYQSLLGLAQTGPVLLVIPLVGRMVQDLGLESVLGVLAALLVLTLAAARRAEGGLAGSATPSPGATPVRSSPA
jgi:MFS family permease